MKDCPGVGSKQAGKADACKGCPNANKCATAKPDEDIPLIKNKFKSFKNIVAVMCGKGGVGKSFLSFVLAKYLAKTHSVLLLDLDLSGPSIPRLTNTEIFIVEDTNIKYKADDGLDVLSAGHFLNSESLCFDSQTKNYFIKNMFKNCDFSGYDILILDTPPNITDEHLALFNYMENIDSVLISSPQALAIADLKRQASFCKKANINILGMVENMSGIKCGNCNHINTISEKSLESEIENVYYFGSLPYDRNVAKDLDSGKFEFTEDITAVCSEIKAKMKEK